MLPLRITPLVFQVLQEHRRTLDRQHTFHRKASLLYLLPQFFRMVKVSCGEVVRLGGRIPMLTLYNVSSGNFDEVPILEVPIDQSSKG